MTDKDRDYNLLWRRFIDEGEQESLSVIYMDHYDLLFNYGYKFTKETNTIEDSIQNVFSYFLKTRKSLPLVNNIRGYILQCFRRQLFLDIKKQKRITQVADIPEDSFGYFSSPEQDILNKESKNELKTMIRESISHLSARQKEMIYLIYVFGLTYEEISAILGISVESCYKTVYRSLCAIRNDAEKLLDK